MPSIESVAAKIQKEGQPVTFRRGSGPQAISATVQAFVRGYQPNQLGDGIIQGDRIMHVVPDDLRFQGWPAQPRNPDRVDIGENTAVVQSVELLYLRGKPCLYIMQIRGG